jgi:hypothetical protein
MKKISWTDHVRNEVLHSVEKERNILHTTEIRKANWIGHTLRRNCLLKHVTEGKIEGMKLTVSQGRKRKQLLDFLKKTKGY